MNSFEEFINMTALAICAIRGPYRRAGLDEPDFGYKFGRWFGQSEDILSL